MEVTLQSRKETKLIPYRTYCYYLLYQSLPQNGYLELCENGDLILCLKECYLTYMMDVRGRNFNGKAFLPQPHNLALMLNCYWFQPYKHTQYSVGVLYLTILLNQI